MPKATLEFSLPEERSDFKLAIDGQKYKFALIDIDNNLRRIIKYEDRPELEEKIYQEIRDLLYQILEGNGINNLYDED